MKILNMKHMHFARLLPISHFALLILCISACSQKHLPQTSQQDDGQIEIAIVQMNDVYEIAGINGGRHGNLARVSAYYRSIQRQYPQSMLVLAGDFLNPSLINTLKFEGKRIMGRQMIETLNTMSLDLVTFGNHEFDLDPDDLQHRIDASDFDWLATNIEQACDNTRFPFYRNSSYGKEMLPLTTVRTFRDADGTTASLGWFTAITSANPRDYVKYHDADSCVGVALQALEAQHTDLQIGLTHVSLDEDIMLAENHPSIDLILGGHEHDHRFEQVGNVRICKADANARTVYLHVLHLDKGSGNVSISSELVEIDESLPKDAETDAVVEKWVSFLNQNISTIIEDPNAVVFHATTPLDARESTIRHEQCYVGELITQAMLAAAQHQPVAAILNSGSIRLDDEITGDITGIDVFRLLPFGGSINEVKIKGGLLKGVLDFGLKEGQGSYLLYSGIRRSDDHWYVNGALLNEDLFYPIAINDFLLKGYDIPFLKEGNPDLVEISKPQDRNDPRYDIRAAIIGYLKSL